MGDCFAVHSRLNVVQEGVGVTRHAVSALKWAVESAGQLKTAGDHTVVNQMARCWLMREVREE